MTNSIAYDLFPVGESAITVDFGNNISEACNKNVIALFHYLQRHPLPGMIEAIPAYSSITVYYDLAPLSRQVKKGQTVFEFMSEQMSRVLKEPVDSSDIEAREITIPICYDPSYGTDLIPISRQKNMSPDELVSIHHSQKYRVFMLGFLPGFAYMGTLDEKISVPRKAQPQTVMPGSVGIAGRQTGIYPLSSPGGWQIIGRTPIRMFDATKENPTMLKAGDLVQFTPISKHEFENY